MKVISVKTEKRLRNALITLVIICMTPLCERGRMLNGAHSANAFAGKDVTCVIDLGDEMYAGHGLETGMNYELLNRFAEDNRCNINIITPDKGERYIDSLKQGRIDILITHAHDLEDHTDSVEISRMLNSCSVWTVSKEKRIDVLGGAHSYPMSLRGAPLRSGAAISQKRTSGDCHASVRTGSQ